MFSSNSLNIKTNGYSHLISLTDLPGTITSGVVDVVEFFEGRGDEIVALKSICMITDGVNDTVVNGLLVNISQKSWFRLNRERSPTAI